MANCGYILKQFATYGELRVYISELGFNPFTVFLDQIDQAVECFSGGDVILHAFFADVEIDLGGCAADVAEISVGHLAGPVHDTAHDGDGNTLEMVGA